MRPEPWFPGARIEVVRFVVEAAFEHAMRLLPDEPRFAEELTQFRTRQHDRSHRPEVPRNGRRSTPR